MNIRLDDWEKPYTPVFIFGYEEPSQGFFCVWDTIVHQLLKHLFTPVTKKEIRGIPVLIIQLQPDINANSIRSAVERQVSMVTWLFLEVICSTEVVDLGRYGIR